jgi:hypothetical protein
MSRPNYYFGLKLSRKKWGKIPGFRLSRAPARSAGMTPELGNESLKRDTSESNSNHERNTIEEPSV